MQILPFMTARNLRTADLDIFQISYFMLENEFVFFVELNIEISCRTMSRRMKPFFSLKMKYRYEGKWLKMVLTGKLVFW